MRSPTQCRMACFNLGLEPLAEAAINGSQAVRAASTSAARRGSRDGAASPSLPWSLW